VKSTMAANEKKSNHSTVELGRGVLHELLHGVCQ